MNHPETSTSPYTTAPIWIPEQRPPDESQPVLTESQPMLTPEPYRRRRSKLLARAGYYAPSGEGLPSTTRQAEVLCTAVSAPPTRTEGIIVGRDLATNQLVTHDPFTAYELKAVTSPNVVVLGDVGKGKSSLIKSVYVLRPLTLRNRRVVVADRKDQGGEGEYAGLARRFGSEPIRFVVGGGGSRLNLLDPAIAVEGSDQARAAGQLQLIRMATALAMGREPDEWEGKAIRLGHRTALLIAEREGRTAYVDDLVRGLLRPADNSLDELVTMAARERLYEAGLGVGFALERLLADDLAGLFDGPTSPDVRLASDLTVFDLSQLPTEGPAVPLVMTVLNTWLTNSLRSLRGRLTTFVAEEGWHLAEGAAAKIFQRNSKLSRGLGLSNVVALHHVSDIPESSPAVAMLKEAETIHFYRQANRDDANSCLRLWSLPTERGEELLTLPQGVHLLKVGSAAPLMVDHLRSALERELTDTDSAMLPGLGPTGGTP